MKILILAERFYPEDFLINDLALTWKKQGHTIEVISQTPSYPHDKIWEGYKNKLFQTTNEFENIKIHRVRTLLGYNKSVTLKILGYFYFAILSSIWAIFNGWKYDRVFTYNTGPLTNGTAALVLRFLWWKKCMIWTQDVWPDTIYSYGIKPRWYVKFFVNILIWIIYKGYKRIIVSSPNFIKKIKPYVNCDIQFCPQWSSESISLNPICEKQNKIFTFAGNIGSVQNLEVLARTFGDLKLKNATLKIVGDGIFLKRLIELKENNHYTNIEFTGRLPRNMMPQIFEKSDILIISLAPQLDLTIPAKFQAYLAAGRPIFGIIRGDTAKMIKDYNLGITADPASPEDIEYGFKEFMSADHQKLLSWSNNAKQLSSTQFSKDKIVAKINALLTEM